MGNFTIIFWCYRDWKLKEFQSKKYFSLPNCTSSILQRPSEGRLQTVGVMLNVIVVVFKCWDWKTSPPLPPLPAHCPVWVVVSSQLWCTAEAAAHTLYVYHCLCMSGHPLPPPPVWPPPTPSPPLFCLSLRRRRRGGGEESCWSCWRWWAGCLWQLWLQHSSWGGLQQSAASPAVLQLQCC